MKIDRLKAIYDKTSGKCHLCHKKLSFKNYGKLGARGTWEIEHSVPKSKKGTNNLNNLFPACRSCNQEKSNGSNQSVRKKNGVKYAPLSKSNREKKIFRNTIAATATGAIAGRYFGPLGIIVGGVIGAIVGGNINPDR